MLLRRTFLTLWIATIVAVAALWIVTHNRALGIYRLSSSRGWITEAYAGQFLFLFVAARDAAEGDPAGQQRVPARDPRSVTPNLVEMHWYNPGVGQNRRLAIELINRRGQYTELYPLGGQLLRLPLRPPDEGYRFTNLDVLTDVWGKYVSWVFRGGCVHWLTGTALFCAEPIWVYERMTLIKLILPAWLVLLLLLLPSAFWIRPIYRPYHQKLWTKTRQ